MEAMKQITPNTNVVLVYTDGFMIDAVLTDTFRYDILTNALTHIQMDAPNWDGDAVYATQVTLLDAKHSAVRSV